MEVSLGRVVGTKIRTGTTIPDNFEGWLDGDIFILKEDLSIEFYVYNNEILTFQYKIIFQAKKVLIEEDLNMDMFDIYNIGCLQFDTDIILRGSQGQEILLEGDGKLQYKNNDTNNNYVNLDTGKTIYAHDIELENYDIGNIWRFRIYSTKSTAFTSLTEVSNEITKGNNNVTLPITDLGSSFGYEPYGTTSIGFDGNTYFFIGSTEYDMEEMYDEDAGTPVWYVYDSVLEI